MTRTEQDLLVTLLGGVTLAVSIGDDYLAYVLPGFRPLLLGAGALLVLLGATGLLRGVPERLYHRLGGLLYDSARRRGPRAGEHDHHGHGHSHGPGVAWLLLVPVAVLLVVAPPALGSFTAARQAGPPAALVEAAGEDAPLGIGADDEGQDYRTMPLMGYVIWSQQPDPTPLEGRTIRLEGFLTPREGGGWYVSRIIINCCAADATPVSVVLQGDLPDDLVADQWVEAIGSYSPPSPHPTQGWPEPALAVEEVAPIDEPVASYG